VFLEGEENGVGLPLLAEGDAFARAVPG
jgi:hypothetical protein